MSIVVTPIPITSMAHSALTGVTTAQHHTAFTGADAITAVEGESTLALSGAVAVDGILTVDVINEKTSAEGVTIDGSLIKDKTLLIDVINEQTGAAGVTINGSLIKDGAFNIDVINEKTGAAGVTVDGALIKDGYGFPLRSTIISGTRAASAGAGDAAYTGAGFTPTTIHIRMCVASADTASWGFGDDAVDETALRYETETYHYNEDTSNIAALGDSDGTDGYTAVLKTLDADGFTLTWARQGSGLLVEFAALCER